MNESNVRAFTPPVNPSPEDVAVFLRQKSERGEIAANSARLKITAITQLAGILADDEPKTAKYLRDNIASIADRWATLNSAGAKGDTARTYESRARAAIDDYFAWVKDPKGFKFRRRESGPREAGAAKETKAEAEASRQPDPHEESARQRPPAQQDDREVRSFPLGPDRESFAFMLPSDGIDVRDVRKIVCHLLTLATDFDPTVPSHAQVFAIVTAQKD